MNTSLIGMLGVGSCNLSNNWRYYIAVASTNSIDDIIEEFIVPECTWAIFSGERHDQSIQQFNLTALDKIKIAEQVEAFDIKEIDLKI